MTVATRLGLPCDDFDLCIVFRLRRCTFPSSSSDNSLCEFFTSDILTHLNLALIQLISPPSSHQFSPHLTAPQSVSTPTRRKNSKPWVYRSNSVSILTEISSSWIHRSQPVSTTSTKIQPINSGFIDHSGNLSRAAICLYTHQNTTDKSWVYRSQR